MAKYRIALEIELDDRLRDAGEAQKLCSVIEQGLTEHWDMLSAGSGLPVELRSVVAEQPVSA